jgi:hypothetical protein
MLLGVGIEGEVVVVDRPISEEVREDHKTCDQGCCPLVPPEDSRPDQREHDRHEQGMVPIDERQIEKEVGATVEVWRHAICTGNDQEPVNDIHKSHAQHDGQSGRLGRDAFDCDANREMTDIH